MFLNTVGGLGSPWWSRGPATGFLDVDDPETVAPDHALVAVIESIAFMLCSNIELLREQCPSVRRIRISGGLSRLDGLCRRIASLSDLEVVRPAQIETTARGIAWLAAGGPDNWVSAGDAAHFEPQSMTELLRRYDRFCAAI